MSFNPDLPLADQVGAPVVRRARLLEPDATGPACRAAPGRHPQLPAPAIASAQLAAGQPWEASVLTQLLAELTCGVPNQPAVRAGLDERLATALSRTVDLAITTSPAELADLTSLALQLAPGLTWPLRSLTRCEYSVRLAALAATLTGQQVTSTGQAPSAENWMPPIAWPAH